MYGRLRRKSGTPSAPAQPRRENLPLVFAGETAIRHKDAPAKMLTETERIRKAILKAARKTGRTKRLSPHVFCALKKPHFPLSFFVRNMLALQGEHAWRGVAPRIWKRHLYRMLEERSRIFLEVMQMEVAEVGKGRKPTSGIPSFPGIPRTVGLLQSLRGML